LNSIDLTEHPENAPTPTSPIPEGNDTVDRLVQPENAVLPIEFKLSGKDIARSPTQP